MFSAYRPILGTFTPHPAQDAPLACPRIFRKKTPPFCGGGQKHPITPADENMDIIVYPEEEIKENLGRGRRKKYRAAYYAAPYLTNSTLINQARK